VMIGDCMYISLESTQHVTNGQTDGHVAYAYMYVGL